MKRIYNNMLDRESLSRDAEGVRVYNNKLRIISGCRRLDRARLSKWTRVTGKQYKWECVRKVLTDTDVALIGLFGSEYEYRIRNHQPISCDVITEEA